MVYSHTHTHNRPQIFSLLRHETIVTVVSLIILFTTPKLAFASQIRLQVEIPSQVIVDIEGRTLTTIYSNLGRLPKAEEIIWKEQGRTITADDTLTQKFLDISATLDWRKAGVIYKRETILEKIVSLLS